jgi:hypothetical protein
LLALARLTHAEKDRAEARTPTGTTERTEHVMSTENEITQIVSRYTRAADQRDG